MLEIEGCWYLVGIFETSAIFAVSRLPIARLPIARLPFHHSQLTTHYEQLQDCFVGSSNIFDRLCIIYNTGPI